jgi:hypothetical protein
MSNKKEHLVLSLVFFACQALGKVQVLNYWGFALTDKEIELASIARGKLKEVQQVAVSNRVVLPAQRHYF